MKRISMALAGPAWWRSAPAAAASENKAANTVVEDLNLADDNLGDRSRSAAMKLGNETAGNAAEANAAAGNEAGNAQ